LNASAEGEMFFNPAHVIDEVRQLHAAAEPSASHLQATWF
jgi:hypothetical protein